MISDYLVGKMMGLLNSDDSGDSEKWIYIYIYSDWAAIKTDVYSDI